MSGCRDDVNTKNKGKGEILVPELIERSFEEHVSEYTIVNLETTDESLISKVAKLKVFDGRIYILEESNGGKLLVFDSNGKYIMSIGHRGLGPEEFVGLSNFEIDYSAKELLLCDLNGRKILIFDIDGNYINTVGLTTHTSCVARLENRNFVYAHGIHRLKGNDYFAMAICSPEGEILNRQIKNKASTPIGFAASNMMNNHYGRISLMPQFNNTIYHIDQNGEASAIWTVRFQSDMIDINDIGKHDINDFFEFFEFTTGKHYMLGNHLEANDFIYIYNMALLDAEIIVYDKLSKKTKRFTNPAFGCHIAVDEDDCIWGALDETSLTFYKPQNKLVDQLKELINADDNLPLIKYKLKSIN